LKFLEFLFQIHDLHLDPFPKLFPQMWDDALLWMASKIIRLCLHLIRGQIQQAVILQ
jgi:hypothetical protein